MASADMADALESYPLQRLPQEPSPSNAFADDTGHIHAGDKVLLIVENDNNFAHFLFDMAHERGYKAVVVGRGGAAIAKAREVQPTAITLDINLPDFDGCACSIGSGRPTPVTYPVQIIHRHETTRGLRMGAMGTLTKRSRARRRSMTRSRAGRHTSPHTAADAVIAINDQANARRTVRADRRRRRADPHAPSGTEAIAALSEGGLTRRSSGSTCPRCAGSSSSMRSTR